jgi:predicted nucleic acid-binding Zn ribbon protein
MSEAARVYQHFREIFGDTRPRAGRARSRTRETSGSEPFTPGRDPKPLGDAIDGLTTQLGWAAPLSQHEMLASWAEVAGEETAKHSEPIAIENGVLQVRCESTAWATQLRPHLEKGPQIGSRARSARYLRLTRQIRSLHLCHRPRSALPGGGRPSV